MRTLPPLGVLLPVLLHMAIGGTTAYFLSWRGVFGIYSVLAAVSTTLLFVSGRHYPSAKNPGSSFFGLYGRLLRTPASLRLYLIVLLEGILIIGSFSYLGAYISKTYRYNYFYIGLIMTAFGIAAMIGGRMSGKLGRRLRQKNLVVSGLIIASAANVVLYFLGYQLGFLILGVTLLGFGLMLAHSTLLTIATEFAAQARGAAMSLAAFCFMGGGGGGTAIGGKVIGAAGFNLFYLSSGLILIALASLAAVWVTARAVSEVRA